MSRTPPTHLCVVGTTGSGKSTLARGIAARLGLAAVELDGLFHQADWQRAPRDDFRASVLATLESAEASYGGWVVDGNYRGCVGDLLAERADAWIWLDFPRRLVMVRLVRRTFDRMLFRRELWNGNRERWRNLFRRDPELNILLWAWTTHQSNHDRYRAEASTSTTTWVRLRSPQEADRWLASLS